MTERDPEHHPMRHPMRHSMRDPANPTDLLIRFASSRRQAGSGFTLIEVLIVVAVIGILASIAYPSYAEYAKKTRRSDAHLALLSAAQTMERCKSTTYTYVGCTVTPAVSPEGLYDIALDSTATATRFTLKATPATGGLQISDTDCARLTMDSLGQKGATAASAGGTAGADTAVICW